MAGTLPEAMQQVLLALAFYVGLVLLTRLSGKRLAGQMTTFDLVVLITMSVALQSMALREGRLNAFVFVLTVFLAHRGLTTLAVRSRRVRRLVRGAPRPLVWNGQVVAAALAEEGLSYEELLAGLRKLGHAHPGDVRLATLEETGHISAIPFATANRSQQEEGAATAPVRG